MGLFCRLHTSSKLCEEGSLNQLVGTTRLIVRIDGHHLHRSIRAHS